MIFLRVVGIPGLRKRWFIVFKGLNYWNTHTLRSTRQWSKHTMIYTTPYIREMDNYLMGHYYIYIIPISNLK